MEYILLIYGIVIIIMDFFGVYNPKSWVEYVERQFIYRRTRSSVGSFFVLLGAVPVYWIMQTEGLALYVGAATSAVFMLIGALMLALPDSLRNMLLSLGALDDKYARMFFAADFAFGVFLILLAI